MPQSVLPQPLSNWRLPALGLAVVLIVVTPFLLLRQAAHDTNAAWAMVAHTHETAATVHSLAGDMRNMESGALSLAAGVDNALLRSRVGESRERLIPTLEALQALTRDNPGQQVRIGSLQTNILLRKAHADRIIDAGADDVTAADIDAMVARYPIHDLVDEIVAEEARLLDERQARAERLEQRARVATWAAMIGQLLLLGGLLLYSTRQMSHRHRAETDAQRASARARLRAFVASPIVSK